MKKRNLLTVLALAGTFVLGACAPAATTTTAGSTTAGSTTAATTAAATTTAAPTEVVVGVYGAKHELWDKIKENLAKENINIKLVEFTDYNTPNIALNSGDLDLNSFQHHIYFEDWVKKNSAKLVAIGDTFLSPIGLYSKKYKAVTEIKAGDEIAIPNDPTNLGRALRVLEAAALIKLKDPANLAPAQEDIVENKLNLKITELDAAQIPRSLEDVAAAIINTDIAVDAGFSPADDAIFLEPVTDGSKPYFNLIAAQEAKKDDPILKKVVAAYQTQEIGDLMLQVYKGAQFPVWEGYIKK